MLVERGEKIFCLGFEHHAVSSYIFFEFLTQVLNILRQK